MTVEELPIGLSTNDFLEWLDKMNVGYENHCTDTIINIKLRSVPDGLEKKLKSSIKKPHLLFLAARNGSILLLFTSLKCKLFRNFFVINSLIKIQKHICSSGIL
jgi:hypothetical protein